MGDHSRSKRNARGSGRSRRVQAHMLDPGSYVSSRIATETRRSSEGRPANAEPARRRTGGQPALSGVDRPRRKEYVGGRRGHRKRSASVSRGGTYLAIIGVLVAGVALTAFVLTRPASALITAKPEDAMILFDGSVAATGTLEVEDLKPGTYGVVVERSGFETATVSVELKRWRKTKLDYDLVPLPQPVSVVTHPEGAACTIP